MQLELRKLEFEVTRAQRELEEGREKQEQKEYAEKETDVTVGIADKIIHYGCTHASWG